MAHSFTTRILSIFLICLYISNSVFAAVGTSADIQIAPPTNVQAESINALGDTRVSWDASPHEASNSVNNYKVQYKLSTDPDTAWQDVSDGGNNGIVYPPDPNEYIVTGLTLNSEYDFRVLTVSKYDDTLSNTITSRTDDPDAAAVGVSVVAISSKPTPPVVTIPSSTINTIGIISTWSNTAGSATLTGSATSNGSALLIGIRLSIQNTNTGSYWNGTSWQGGSSTLDASMVDGALNGSSENWEYLGLSESDMIAGDYLISVTSTSQDASQPVPTTATFTYESPISSSFDVVDGSDLVTLSNTVGAATLRGSATTSGDTLSKVQITIQRTTDNLYWNGTSWQASQSWRDTDAVDGTFDAANESWEYLKLPTAQLTAGETYILTPRAERSDNTQESNLVSHTFSFQKNLPNIGSITAGPDDTNRTSIVSGSWVNAETVGNDALMSFAWGDPASTSGDTFYYLIDENSLTNSIDSNIGNELSSTTTPYLDLQPGQELNEGISYLHVQPQNNDGVWGIERVFEIKYDATAPTVNTVSTTTTNGSYAPGTNIDFTISFSEEVTAPSDLTIQFDSGGTAIIPAFTDLRNEITGIYTIGTFESSTTLSIQIINGTIIDKASNSAINAVPLENLHSSAEIEVTGITVNIIDPAELNGVYETDGDTITFRVSAPSATRMRVPSSSGFDVSSALNDIPFDEWIDYNEAAINIALSAELGARIFSIEFENGMGDMRAVHTIVTRLGTEPVLIAEQELQESLMLEQEGSMQESITAYLPDGIDITNLNSALLNELSQAIARGDADAIQSATNTLIAILAQIEELRALLTAGDTETLLDKLISFLENYSLKINFVFTATEINELLTLLSAEEITALMPYLDPGIITFDIDEETKKPVIIEQPLSIRDSDGDGLSDLLELEYGSNPYLVDTDGDGYSDGAEVLDLGTDPTVFDAEVSIRFTNIKAGMTFNDPVPVIRGTSIPNANISVVAVGSDGEILTLGTAIADEENKWIMVSDTALTDGTYELQLIDANGTIHDTREIIVDLDFVLPAPELVATSEGDIAIEGELVFVGDQPVFYGNTYYGSTIVASFQSLLTSTSVIADNPEGDFEIRPPRKLEAGGHTLTLYAELPDGTRSSTKIITFTVDPVRAAALARQQSAGSILSIKNIILLMLLTNFGILLFEAWKEGDGQGKRRRMA